jgi:hypothetical protein
MCCIYREEGTKFSGIARFMNVSKRWVDRRVLADCSRFDSRTTNSSEKYGRTFATDCPEICSYEDQTREE